MRYEQVYFVTDEQFGEKLYWVPYIINNGTDENGKSYVTVMFDGLGYEISTRALVRSAKQASDEVDALCQLSNQIKQSYIFQGDAKYVKGVRMPLEQKVKSKR